MSTKDTKEPRMVKGGTTVIAPRPEMAQDKAKVKTDDLGVESTKEVVDAWLKTNATTRGVPTKRTF